MNMADFTVKEEENKALENRQRKILDENDKKDQIKKALKEAQNIKIKSENKNTFPNGILYLKGGDLNEELKDFKNIEIYQIQDFFTDDFFETKKVVRLTL